MEAFEDENAYNQAFAANRDGHQQFDHAPPRNQQLGAITVACLVLNRTIGSGIFLSPSLVLKGTGSVGVSLILWALGALYGLAGLDCWLQFGLSVPYQLVPAIGQWRNVPLSGGEKNYIEYVFSKFKLLPTTMYGIPFILLGNLVGNAIAFAKQCVRASGRTNDIDAHRGAVTGIAVAVLAVSTSLHVFSRRGGIFFNNVFAVLKICILLTIIVLGFIKVGGGFSGSGLPNGRDNFRVSQSFKSSSSTDVASIVDSIFFICYTYSGFDQPFYVLSEVSRPREIFPKATNIAMGIAGFLFFLTNVAFFCAVPKDMAMNSSLDMATLFFNNIFGNEKAERALAAIIAFTIFGNILVMTFTAARVKQEIAKEGILPYSLTFATGYVTPWAWLMRRFQARPAIETEAENERNIEYTPMAALGLHFLSSLFLVAITSGLKVDTAYNFLVILYSYVLVSLVGFVVSGGLLYLTFFKRSEWRSILAYKGWLGPVPAIFYFVANGFFLFAAFAKPSDGSPYSQKHTGLPWYLVPTIGLSSLTWGVIWYGGFKLYSRIAKKRMVHVRTRFLLPENVADPGGRWLQRSEMVVIRWPTRVRSSRSSLAEAGEDTNSLHSSNAEVAAKE